jgi:phosphatidylglycerol:prolipoprotein diacylglycerol transferase
MVWNVDPVLVEIGPLSIRYYGLFFALAFLLGHNIIRAVFRREEKPEEDLAALLLFMMAGTIAGARLGHCLFYDPGYYLSHPLEIVMFWTGGLASHGGAIGILAALFVYARHRPDQPYLWLLDRIAIVVALGGFFIRLGNLFNSEILGLPSDLPWAIVFARIDDLPRHPAQLYESFAYGTIFAGLYSLYLRLGQQTPRGLLFGLFLAAVFGFRFLVEFLKERQAAFSADLLLSVGQMLSLPLLLLGVALLARLRRSQRSRR